MKNRLLISLSIVVAVLIVFNLNFNGRTGEKPDKTLIKKENIISLKMAHNIPVNSALHEASVLFAKKVKEKTKGKVQITVYPEQKLGNDHQMVEMARNGDIDILLTPTAKMSVAVPSMQYADLPFLFPTREDAYELLDGDPGKMILKDLDKIGLLGVAFWENGFKHFTGNEPLLTPEDFKGKKIRVMKSRIIMEQFNALGAKPVPIDFHATKKALADGVVDGQENPLVAIVNMGFHEVQSHLTISEHAYLPYVFSISKKSFAKIPIDIQNILINTALEVTPWEREETRKREKQFLETIKKAGVKIHILSKEQKEKFREVTEYIPQMYEDIIGPHIISKTQEMLYKKYKPANTIVIGLDADLSMGSKEAGLAIKRGAQLAIDDINAKGGLLGKQVVLIAKDHKTISTQGVKNVRELIADPNVKVIIGGKQSAVISAEMEYIQKGSKPYISPWAAAQKIVDNGYEPNYIFRVSSNDQFVVKKLFYELLKKHKKPLIIVENSIWGRDALKLMEGIASKEGIYPLNSLTINRGERDFLDVIKNMEEKNIDSILMVLNATEGSKIVDTISKKDISIPIVSHWGILGGDFYKTNKRYLDAGLDLKFIQSFSFSHPSTKKGGELGVLYLKKYGKDHVKEIIAPSAVAQAYDAVQLLSRAVKKADSFEGSKIKEQLEQLKYYEGVIKIYNKPFGIKDHEGLEIKDFFFARFDKHGNIVPLNK